jgi:DNA-binding transcriptional regulator YdaS (Cro superfamily)
MDVEDHISNSGNRLAEFFDTHDVTKLEFSRQIGVTPSYVSQLAKSRNPNPTMALAKKIAIATRGFVTPNDLAGYVSVRQRHIVMQEA